MHTYDYFEYVLRHLRYKGVDQYIVRRLGHHEVIENANNDAINALKNACMFQGKDECGIGSLKQKWRRLMKRFDSTRCKYVPSFMATSYLTNYLHERYLGFTYIVLECNDEDDGGWGGDL